MELRQVEHFVAVAEEGHFTRAAARMHIAQSGLSSSIRALEADLGGRLFTRTTRRVTLTAAGRTFLPAARALLEAAGEARRTVSLVEKVESGSLTVGTIPTAGSWFDVAGLLARFHHRHPNVEIHLSTGVAGELVEQVRMGELDLALVTLPASLPGGVGVRRVAAAPYALACGTDRASAFRSPVPLARLHGERFVDVQPGSVIRQVTDGAFADAGITRTVAFEVGDLHTLVALVRRGMGIACLPQLPEPSPPGIAFRALGGSWPTWTLALVTREHDAPAAASSLVALAAPTDDRPGGNRDAPVG
jgi:DNA-binding transcriptional LysR family regulator